MKTKKLFLLAVLLASVSSVFATEEEVNLIVNGDFSSSVESGSYSIPTDWEVTYHEENAKSIFVEQHGTDGSNSIKLGIASTETQCAISQDIDVQLDSTYLFTCDLWYSQSPTNKAVVIIENADTQEEIARCEMSSGSTGTSQPTSCEHTFTFTSTASRITFTLASNGMNKVLRADNFSLTKTTPPDLTTQSTYYVDPVNGENSNTGLTAEEPLQSLEGVILNNAQPGTLVLFKSGTCYEGTLKFESVVGTEQEPIVVTTYYGEGETEPATIDGAGYIAAIDLVDCGYFEVSDLVLTANGGGWVVASDEGEDMRCGLLSRTTSTSNTLSGIHLSNLLIDSCFYYDNGYVRPDDTSTSNGSGGYGYGIRIFNQSNNTILSDVTITGCTISNISHTGVKFTGAGTSGAWIENVETTDTHILHAGGPGFQMGSVRYSYFGSNSVNYSGSDSDSRNWTRGSGLWTWGCNDIVIEKSSFMNSSGPADSFGSHIDYNCSNIVFQYNFYANNTGGFVEILGNSYNCSYRYNISVNDGTRTTGQPGRTLWLSGYCGSSTRTGPFDTYIYNNTIYTNEDILSQYSFEYTAVNVLLVNNIFHVMGDSDTADSSKSKPDGDDVYFKNNLFLKEDNFPTIEMGGDSAPLYGDAQFVNPGGLTAEDYIPTNTEFAGKGIAIPAFPDDEIGLVIGLDVEYDLLGNAIGDNIPLGAIALDASSGIEETATERDFTLRKVNSHIIIERDGELEVSVYDVKGACVLRKSCNDLCQLVLGKGIYIIRINDETVKVAN